MAVSKAQQKAVHKYVKANYDRLELTLPKGQKEEVKNFAAAQGESVNAFIARLIEEAGRFTLDDVCDAECRKLIFRHPALFGGEAKSWDEVKQQEKGQTTVTETLDGVARSLPATWRSEKLQKKAAKCGFAWESAAECLGKLEEETAELRDAIEEGVDPSEELGDMLFAAVNVAAFLQKDPEQVLHDACEKFIRRFGAMESAARQAGRSLDSLSREELLSLWSQQKTAEQKDSAKT